jgi:NUMOD3 motif
MTIYLYVKTHQKTGLKYLGKTTKSDPYGYTGSGIHWIRHLKLHGYDYSTEILKECQSPEELKEWGLYYSNLWNIVESDEWANLKPEIGDGGNKPVQSKETRLKMSIASKGKPKSKEHKQKLANILKENYRKTQSLEIRQKISDSHKGKIVSEAARLNMSNAQKGKKHSEETKQKMRESHKARQAKYITKLESAELSLGEHNEN